MAVLKVFLRAMILICLPCIGMPIDLLALPHGPALTKAFSIGQEPTITTDDGSATRADATDADPSEAQACEGEASYEEVIVGFLEKLSSLLEPLPEQVRLQTVYGLQLISLRRSHDLFRPPQV